MLQRNVWGMAAATLGLCLTACAPPATPAAPEGMAPSGAAGGPTVAFAQPAAGATVTSPVEACLTASGVTIEKSGDVHAGAGHHHVLVDPTPAEIAALSTVPLAAIAKDETHVHLGDGGSCVQLTLAPGPHHLLAVVADGAHIPLQPPVKAELDVTVQ
jgi:hypothetical protein